MINKYCENCGKILNKNTLICDACGTDYNDCPNCEYKKQFDYISGSGSFKELQTLRKHKEESFTREELEALLYAIAANNLDGVARDRVLASDCEEIIGRLDGFERFVQDRREGKI